ncbi:MAG: hypothetical protein M4D80_24400 [Myxococcota bacterium]|nr:hypothetical protein [Myxococcota bacterium]
MKRLLLALLLATSCTSSRTSEIPESEAMTLAEFGGPLFLSLPSRRSDDIVLSFGDCERLRTQVAVEVENRPPSTAIYGGLSTTTTSGGHSESSCTSPTFAWAASLWPTGASTFSVTDHSASWHLTVDLTGLADRRLVLDPTPDVVRAGDAVTVRLTPAPVGVVLSHVGASFTSGGVTTKVSALATGATLQLAIPATAPGPATLTVEADAEYSVAACGVPGGCQIAHPVLTRATIPLVIE